MCNRLMLPGAWDFMEALWDRLCCGLLLKTFKAPLMDFGSNSFLGWQLAAAILKMKIYIIGKRNTTSTSICKREPGSLMWTESTVVLLEDRQQNQWIAGSLTSSATFQIAPPGSYTTRDDTPLLPQLVRLAGSPALSCCSTQNNKDKQPFTLTRKVNFTEFFHFFLFLVYILLFSVFIEKSFLGDI